jgi:hypothetical protein
MVVRVQVHRVGLLPRGLGPVSHHCGISGPLKQASAAEIERAMICIATSADDLERISGGLREATGRFQV